jgi:hypothetical protein
VRGLAYTTCCMETDPWTLATGRKEIWHEGTGLHDLLYGDSSEGTGNSRGGDLA